MNLFLCTTPFQLFLAHKITKNLSIKPEQASFIYVGYNTTEAVKNSIKEIKELGFNIKQLQVRKEKGIKKHLQIILLNSSLLDMIFMKKYSAVYLASIDQKIFHFILSWIKFDKLFTFDDGTANIFPNSIYYKNKKKRTKRKIKNYILGIKYDMNKIKTKSQLHYTVYKEYNNIIENTQHISLTEHIKKTNSLPSSRKNSCSVILGTVYPGVFEENIDIESIIKKCINYVRTKKNDLYYIPHPRDTSNLNIARQSILLPVTIAEKEIVNLLEKYDSVFLYSFMSSCQFNLESIKRINNSIFFSEKMRQPIKQSINSNLIPNSFEIIKIDDFEQNI